MLDAARKNWVRNVAQTRQEKEERARGGWLCADGRV